MSKRVPNEERRVSTTFAVSQITIQRIDELAAELECSRSAAIKYAIDRLWEDWHREPEEDSDRDDQ